MSSLLSTVVGKHYRMEGADVPIVLPYTVGETFMVMDSQLGRQFFQVVVCFGIRWYCRSRQANHPENSCDPLQGSRSGVGIAHPEGWPW